MTIQGLRRIATRGIAAAIMALGAEAAIAQRPFDLARTPDGRPDLQGVWQFKWMTPLERPPGVDVLNLNAEEAKALAARMTAFRLNLPGNANPPSDTDFSGLAFVDGSFRTSLIVDPPSGKLPFTEEGARRRDIYQMMQADNPEERAATERCIAGGGGAPMLAPPTNAYVQIVQPPGNVVFLAEALSDVRIVPLGGAKRSSVFASLHGDSTGRWDGDTLVIETRNLRADVRFAAPMSRVVYSPDTTIVETFTPVSAREIRYRVTVTDPVVYSRPWTAETSYIRTTDRMFEYACHEGNYALANILKGGREQEHRVAVHGVK
jgi:hypothetical protein